jgi:uncharacterized protein (UPF0297 family)
VIESRSVDIGDIDPNANTEYVRQRIRDGYIRDATVTVVLVGKQTWQRKHVDWEIYSSLRDTQMNPRNGLLGILLPTYPGYSSRKYDPHTIPPRLYDNKQVGYAEIYLWTTNPSEIEQWIHEAFKNRQKQPNNSRRMFGKNRSTSAWE